MNISTQSKAIGLLVIVAVLAMASFAIVALAPTAQAAYSFSANLKQGSTGADVMELQKMLNTNAATQVSTSGAGSPGSETSYFGVLTKAAVIKYQELNAADVLAPVGLSKGTGYFGPSSRAKANAAGGATTTTTSTVPGCTSTAGYSPTTGQKCDATTTTGTTTGGALSVSAGTQPGNSLAPESAARVPFTTFTVTAGSTSVDLSSVTVERTGLAANAVFSGVILLDQNGVQLGTVKTLNSNNQAVVGEKVTIPAGQTRTFTVAGNMAADNSTRSGQVVSLNVVAVNTSVTVSGSLPITGAAHTVNNTLDIGSATYSVSSFDPNTAQTKEIGTTGVRLSGIYVTAGSAEDVRIKSIRWNHIGSAGSGDIGSVVTVAGGTEYPTVVSADGKYYTSVFGSGIVVAKGNNTDIYAKADILGGPVRTVEFDIDKNTDVYLTGETYGYGITGTAASTGAEATNTSTFSTDGSPFFSASLLTISAGSATTIQKSATVSAQNIAVNVPNQPLGAFETDIKGEAINISGITMTVASTTGSGTGLLTSVTIVDQNGAVRAGPIDATYTSALVQTLTFTDSMTIPVGKMVYTVKGKVASNIGNGGTYIVSVTPSGWSSPVGNTTGNTITISQGVFTLNTMTIRAAALGVSISTQPVAQTVITGSQGFLYANVNLDASQSGEDVRFSSIPLSMTFATMTVGQVTNCQLFDGAAALNTGSNVVNPSGGTDTDQTFTFDTALTIPKGTVKTLALKCNLASDVSASDSLSWGINSAPSIAVTGVTSGNNVTETITDSAGQTMTVAANGSYTVTNDSALLYKISQAGTTGVVLAQLRFTAGASENINLQQVALELGNTASNSPADLVGQRVTLWNGATQVGTAQFGVGASSDNATSTLLSPAPLITAGGSVLITVKGDLTAQDVINGTPGAFFAITYDGDNVGTNGNYAKGVSSQANISSGTTADVTTNGTRIFRAVPTIAVTSNGGTLGAGTDLYKFTVTNPTGADVVFHKFSMSVATSGGATNGFILYGDGIAFNASTSTVASETLLELVGTDTSNAKIVPANGSKTYILKATTAVDTASVSESINLALLADTSYPSLANLMGTVTTVEAGSAATDNIIWSPFSTTTAVATLATQSNLDWTNGYGMTGFPSNTDFPVQVWTRSN